MPYIAKSEGGYQGPPIPDDTYNLTVKEVTFEPANGQADQWGNIKDKVRVRFRLDGLIDDATDGPVYVDPLMSASLADGAGGRFPASNYYKMCIALGVAPEILAVGIDTDDLVGLKCKGIVVTAPEVGAWPKVTQYLRLPPKSGAVRPQEARQPARRAAPAEGYAVDESGEFSTAGSPAE